MKIIDAHVHVGKWVDPACFGRMYDLSETVRELTEAGVRAAFVFPTDAKDNAGLLAEVKHHRAGKSGFEAYFFPWVDLEASGFLNFLETELDWISGLKIHPSYDRKPVTDPSYTPFFEWADRNRRPVIIHCGRWQEVAGYGFALQRAAEFGNTPFVLSHLGGDLPALQDGAFREVRTMDLGNVSFGTESVREYWNLERGIRELGARRFLFGSDFSLGHPSIYRAVLGLCSISEDEMTRVLGLNALDIIRPPEDR